ncbi:helix-turn-helix domain-containing protein [Ahrensia marina]|uniref:Uncharacterized protein n=1 Tax=Ahrensia marina TaxID=1514904 RepID=A0A0N0VKX2_9HYPH|nr:helix-turn-helix domain-containing protein [Ahrensia marina]KPA99963.1 hypothetical protein SU32_16285 [Ahrensia marina]
MSENKELTEDEKKTFSSWKFDVLDRIMRDHKLAPIDKTIGYCIIQHVNAVKGQAYPSTATIAGTCNCHIDAVSRSTGKLAKRGWITKRRNVKGYNEYMPGPPEKIERLFNEIDDAVQYRIDKRQEQAKNRAEAKAKSRQKKDLPVFDLTKYVSRKGRGLTKREVHELTKDLTRDLTKVRDKHLCSELPNNNTEEIFSDEQEANNYQAMKDGTYEW